MIRTYSDRSLGAYYIYDKNTDELKHIVDVSPWINEDEMAAMKPVQYQSRDGLTINHKGFVNARAAVDWFNARYRPDDVHSLAHGAICRARLSFLSADLAFRVQYLIMAVIVLSIASILLSPATAVLAEATGAGKAASPAGASGPRA